MGFSPLKKMNHMSRVFIIAICLGSLLFSCKQDKKAIISEKDYVQFLRPASMQLEKKRNADEISFWQKRLANDTGSYVNKLELANNYLRRFRLTGEIDHLLTGDSLLKRSSEKL